MLYKLLLLVIIYFFLISTNAQWKKIPIGSKLYYTSNYYKLNDNDTLYRSKSKFIITIDTVLKLSGNNRNLIILTDIFDTYGGPGFKMKNNEVNIDIAGQPILLRKKSCTIIYIIDDTILFINMPKIFRNKLNQKKMINRLDDSLMRINSDDFMDKYGEVHFNIFGNAFSLQPFRLLVGSSFKRQTKFYNPHDLNAGFYTLYDLGKENEYISPNRRSSAYLEFSYNYGIIKSYTHIVANYSKIFILELNKIVTPEKNILIPH
jgi:hypothetical protein